MSHLLLARSAAASLTLATLAATLSAAPVLPDFSAAEFDPEEAIDNTYFPAQPGTVYRYSADVEDDEGGSEFLEIEEFVTFERETVAGVSAHVVRAREWIYGLLVEDTFDWYAQDTAGNVWYLGEDSTAFEYDDEDNLIGTSKEGSWRAGENGAQAGFIMPADPTVGFNYYQEFAPADGAVDQATVLATDETLTTPLGDFTNVLRTRETSELEPDLFEHKLYAPGIGLVLILEDFDELGQAQTVIPLRSVSVIPLPSAGGIGALLGLVLLTRRQRGAAA